MSDPQPIKPTRHGYTVRIPADRLVCDECGQSLVGVTRLVGWPGPLMHPECDPLTRLIDEATTRILRTSAPGRPA